MIICFEVVFNRVLSNRKTHIIVKLETFPHSRRARAGFGWGLGAVRPPPMQEPTLESGTGRLTGQDKPQQDRAERAGRAKVGRIDDLDLDLAAPLSWRQTSQVPGLYRLTILKISR
jgi:hypothetical protein